MIAAAIIALLAAVAFMLRTVSIGGAMTGWALATALYLMAGWRGMLLLALLFLVTTAATRIGFDSKRALGIEQSRGGRRGASHVIANIAVGLLFAFLGRMTGQDALFASAMAAAFATAACDTVASEIGKGCGGRTYLITTLERVRPGRPGGVTLVGSVSGAAAALSIAVTAWGSGLTTAAAVPIVTGAAFAAALIESCLRATLLSGRSLGGLANLLNTMAGALIALGLCALTGSG